MRPLSFLFPLSALALTACAPVPLQQAMVPGQPRIEPMLRVSGVQPAKAQLELGRYYLGQRRLELAERAFERAVQADAQLVEAWNGLGTARAQARRYAAAVEAFEQALVRAPQQPHLHNNLGYARLLEGESDLAAVAFRRALELDPQNQRALNNLALLFERQTLAVQAGERRATEAATEVAKGVVTASAKGAAKRAEGAATLSLAGRSSIALTAPAMPTRVSSERGLADGPLQPGLVLPTAASESRTTSLPIQAVTVSPIEKRREPTVDVPKPETVQVGKARKDDVGPDSAPASLEPRGEARREVASDAGLAHGRANNEGLPASARSAMHKVELSNGNGRDGLAAELGRHLRQAGYARPRLTNARPFAQGETVVQYRAGFEQEAHRVKQALAPAIRVDGSPTAGLVVPVRVVIGKDATGANGWLAALRSSDRVVALGDDRR